MSAFIVSEKHITAMINSMIPHYSGDSTGYYWDRKTHYFNGNSQEIGQKLLEQNYRSVNSRYGKSIEAPVYKGILSRTRSPIEIIKACHCYNYQSCETDNWQYTEAYAISKAIEAAAVRRIAGYEEANWEIK